MIKAMAVFLNHFFHKFLSCEILILFLKSPGKMHIRKCGHLEKHLAITKVLQVARRIKRAKSEG